MQRVILSAESSSKHFDTLDQMVKLLLAIKARADGGTTYYFPGLTLNVSEKRERHISRPKDHGELPST